MKKKISIKKHFVVFSSPGTLFSEETIKEIAEWDTEKAIIMSKEIKERYGATPYGFCFITRGRTGEDLDSKEIKRSNFYYLGGEIKTLKELRKENNPGDIILIRNMECNNWDKVIINNNSWKWTQPFAKGDVLLNV